MKSAIALFVLMVCATACVADEGAKQPPTGASDESMVRSEQPSQWRQAVDVAIVTAASVEALKRAIRDPRPHGEGHAHGFGYGFPSGDATLAFALARVASEYHHEHRALWYALAARVAWSRVKRQAHDWDDVIGGALLGSWIGDTAVSEGGIVLKRWEW